MKENIPILLALIAVFMIGCTMQNPIRVTSTPSISASPSNPTPSPDANTFYCPDGATTCFIGQTCQKTAPRCYACDPVCRNGVCTKCPPCRYYTCTGTPDSTGVPTDEATILPNSSTCPDGTVCAAPQICEASFNYDSNSKNTYHCSTLPYTCFDIPAKPIIQEPLQNCLPTTTCNSVTADEIVKYTNVQSGTTVLQTLTAMAASCNQGNLYDAKGKPIVFYKIACFGNAPSNYYEIEEDEKAEIQQLKTQDNVITIGCNPGIA